MYDLVCTPGLAGVSLAKYSIVVRDEDDDPWIVVVPDAGDVNMATHIFGLLSEEDGENH